MKIMTKYKPLLISLFNNIYPYTNLSTEHIYYCENKQDKFVLNSTDRQFEMDKMVFNLNKKNIC